ncbi:hypothetical protein HPB50_023957 [Hyalomma asiaticum]|uniref:Uncharacterized protein n=1 Tax=Hyalomma asiaticum TaxID=266040 RepID=A0ACB7S2N1_HYAAI|nr:hypothetical protein HPB50_023957 [Hyalomma asiaticum]
MTQNSSNVSVVGNVLIPAKIMRLLQKGPKFGVEASLSAPNLIAMNRKVADKAQDDNRDRCLLEGVECLQEFAPKSKDFHCSRMFDDVVSFFKSNNLMLTQADKDVDEAKARWKKLRDTFRRALKERNRATKSRAPAGGDDLDEATQWIF